MAAADQCQGQVTCCKPKSNARQGQLELLEVCEEEEVIFQESEQQLEE